MSCAEIISISISMCALIISLITFWYVSFRKGKIIIHNPISFKFFGSPIKKERVLIDIPLTISNTGSKSKILTDLYLIDTTKEKNIFKANALLEKLTQFGDDPKLPILPVVVPATFTTVFNIEFISNEIIFPIKDMIYTFKLSGKINEKKAKTLGEIKLKPPTEFVPQLNQELRLVKNEI